MNSATVPAGYAFDSLAESYEVSFTDSLIGRAQRSAVWRVLEQTFVAGNRVLELNCGTGEDAIFLAQRGISLVCCDASSKMIEVAKRRMTDDRSTLDVDFAVMPTENLRSLRVARPFDGVLSNFSGLNCVQNLARVAQDLAAVTRPEANAILCLSTRFCLWESLYYGLQGRIRKACRRWAGSATARLKGIEFPVRYPTISQVRRAFSPWFELRQIKGIGVFVPPSYVEHWASKHPAALHWLERFDQRVGTWAIFRLVGDHVLLVFERTAP